jgi:NAD(P)H-hydrate epimerase
MIPAAFPPEMTRLAPRRNDSSKRDYGRVVVVGGASGMAGAPALAAMAALRSGAGLVELLAPETVAGIAATFDPCVMTHALPAATDGGLAAVAVETVLPRAAAADAVAIGPGIGRSAGACDLVLRLWRELPQPAVFDADGLWALAQAGVTKLRDHAGPRIITPHAGEMRRLLGQAAVQARPWDSPASAADDRGDLERAAAEMARAIDAVIVLKGPGTLVVDPQQMARNETGNPGMATAGTGDVLTGVTAAVLAQGLSAFDAARLAAWVHGRAGDAAAAELGQVSMTARDLLDRLHVAFRAIE